MNNKLTDERLSKILSETQAEINEHNRRQVRSSVDVDARLLEALLIDAKLYRSGSNNFGERAGRTDLRSTVLSEIGDFFAGLGCLGEPETPEEMRRELSMRVGRIINDHIVNYPRSEVLVEILKECRIARDEAQATLKLLAVIMSGSDAPGEIRSLTVTAQSLVDRCKTLARERDKLQEYCKAYSVVISDESSN